MTGRIRPCSMWPVAMVLVTTTACTSWHPTTLSPREAISGEQPRTVRVTDQDGTFVTVRHPTVRNDSIVTSDTNPLGVPRRESGVATEDIRTLEISRFSPTKTVALVAGTIGAAGLWARAVAGGGGGRNTPPPGPSKAISFSLVDGLRVLGGLIR